jgi:acetolactate synthase I/II/III large subunit
VDFGPVDVVRFAEAFGAKGFRIQAPDDVTPTIRKALEMEGPVIIGVPVGIATIISLWRLFIPVP